MKMRRLWCAVIILIAVALQPHFSSAEVRIELKNGRSIIADGCKEMKDRLICEKMGGTFEIDKQDIQSLKGITIKRKESYEAAPEEPSEAGEAGKETKTGGDAAPAGAPREKKEGEGALIRRGSPEQEKRLDEITARKKELIAQREALVRDRDQLHEDVRNMGMIKSQEEFDAVKKRISGLEARINGFNEEVNRLNAEEERLLGEIKK